MQPKTIKVTDKHERKLYDLPETAIDCVLVEYDNDTKVVYINNPKYVRDSAIESPYTASAPYIALTQRDYQVLTWTK